MSTDQATVSQPPTLVLPPALLPGTSFGAYRIVGVLGEGGMGQVYQAVQGRLERTVALKVMRPELARDPQFAERFLREARAAASVCHQAVVVIFDAGEQDGQLYMAFQFVPGGDLAAKLADCHRMAVVPALDLIAGCCDGLQAIHEAGLVHRDIKPHNIFLDAQGRPKLGDFGLARQAQGSDRMTLTGVGMGTPSYMSPEQAQGLADIDIRADIHALGGTLYTLLTGRVPFSGATPWMVVNAVCNEPAPDPRDVVPAVPAPVAAIVLRCMAKERAQRYATPTELHADLLLVRAALGGGPAPGGAMPQVSLGGSRSPLSGWPWVAGTGALLAVVPLALRPLLELNDRYRLDAWGSAWFAGWLSCLTLEALLVWALVAPAPRSRLLLAVPWLGSAGAIIACLSWAGGALLSVADVRDGGWAVLVAMLALVAGIATAGWLGGRWRRADPTLPGWILPRTLGLAAACTLVAVICHLAIADRPVSPTLREESHTLGANLRRVFHPDEPPSSSPAGRQVGAASAVAWLAPLTLVLLAPAWLSRRRR